MARQSGPGLLHALPALLIGTALLVGAIVLCVTAGAALWQTEVPMLRNQLYPAWIAVLIGFLLGSAVLAFGILSVRQTWREVRERPTREKWFGYR